jgi:DNA invertase Pin-like site-specific DNA recombinase
MQQNEKTPRRQQPITSNVEIPLDYPCQIYPRVSTPEQIKNVSAEMQKDKSFAMSCGWREDLIILDDRDLGVSGQMRMEDRLAFNEMLRRIAKGLIKAVVVVNVDRLFRNKWGDESGKFMEICHRYGVIVVTPDFVFDFRISWHIDRFKRRCEEAWNYLEYHIYGRMIQAQDTRGNAGYWSGGNLPMGYVLDMRKKIGSLTNPNYYRYIVYEPHAKVIRWMFRRFRELNGNVTAMLREILKRPVLFPDFDETIDPFLVRAGYSQYTKIEGGYTIVSTRGVHSVLTNRAYIGYWVYKKEVVSTENHEAIVELDTFAYAYNRLSLVTLNGISNEQNVERRKQYIKRYFSDKPAILKECIQASEPGTRIYTKDDKVENEVRTYYGFYPEQANKVGDRHIRHITHVIEASALDKIVLDKWVEHMLQQPETEQQFQDFTAVEGEVVNEASETLNDIERDIEATKALMTRTLEQINGGKLTDPDLADAANTSYQVAKAELKRLEERKGATKQIASEDEERRSYNQLMREVGECWEEIVMPEEYPRVVYLFIKSVTLAIVAPMFFSVTIEWRDPSWSTDCGLCYKGSFSTHKWTEEEIACLMKYYRTATRDELSELLPRRTYRAMRLYMKGKGIDTPAQKGRVPSQFCLEDWKVIQQYNITEAEFAKWKGVKLIQWASRR